MARLGLRARLTILVTLVFAVSISILSIFGLRAVEGELIDDTRSSAELVLGSYLDSIYGGTATVGVVDSTDTTRFFYLDANGDELTEQQYFQSIAAGFDAEFASAVSRDNLARDEPLIEGVAVGPTGAIEALEIDPSTGALLDSGGAVVSFAIGPQPIGEPHRVDIGDDVVGVAQTLAFDDGAIFEVGVSSPLQPVTDSLDTIRQLLWLAVPALVAVIAAITWLAASRALAPVHAITSQARAITASKITERVPANDANDEIGELASTMNDMLDRLQGAQQRQQQLVADASHELRSPVAASRAQLEVAAANPDTTDWVATTATVLAEQEHLSTLIDDLLALSRLQETGATVEQDVDLDDIISVEAMRPHPTAVRTEVDNPVRIVADRALLTRAVRNLVDNAARHAEEDVLITLAITSSDALIEVHDDGPGVPVDQQERIFDRFTRLDEARDRHRGGAGLGLAIAREVAEAHCGNLTVSTSPLGGAQFTLSLPLRPVGSPPLGVEA